MKMEDIFTNEVVVKWDQELESFLIINPNIEVPSGHVARLRAETILEMNFEQASAFIGSRVALLIPAFRDMFINPETGSIREDGSPNKSFKADK